MLVPVANNLTEFTLDLVMQFWLALLTFLYVDFLDTTGTLFSMANFLNNFIPGEHGSRSQRHAVSELL